MTTISWDEHGVRHVNGVPENNELLTAVNDLIMAWDRVANSDPALSISHWDGFNKAMLNLKEAANNVGGSITNVIDRGELNFWKERSARYHNAVQIFLTALTGIYIKDKGGPLGNIALAALKENW